MSNTFHKTERLSGLKRFEYLMKEGEQFFSFPFRVIFSEAKEDQPFPAQVAFAVPKRKFKKAVDRNRIKRILREAYRRNKSEFYSEVTKRGKKLNVLFVYSHNSLIELKEADPKIILTLQRLIKAIDGTNDQGKKT